MEHGSEASSLPQIILLGDSLTEWGFDPSDNGFGAQLEKYYENRADVINRGYAGYNTNQIKRPFQQILDGVEKSSTPAPLFITIFLGTNDACAPHWPPHVSLPDFEKNIRYYVDELLSNPRTSTTKIILITPPPINLPPSKDDYFNFANYLRKKEYAEKTMEIARSYAASSDRVVGLDFFGAMIAHARRKNSPKTAAAAAAAAAGEAEGDPELLPGSGMKGAISFTRDDFTDGLHLGPAGYQVLYEALLELVTSKFPELRRDALPLDGSKVEV